jgi:hypothetical protein
MGCWCGVGYGSEGLDSRSVCCLTTLCHCRGRNKNAGYEFTP